MYMAICFFLISLATSCIGAICGIGGGVLMKPALDAFRLLPVETVSFLSGCTVLTMAAYTTLRNRRTEEEPRAIVPMAMGAAVGGILGKTAFTRAAAVSTGIGRVQSAAMLVLLVLSLLYTVFESRITTKRIAGMVPPLCLGVLLGFFSSFLGIGGGPFNLMAISYFFSLETKQTAKCSLTTIFYSQAAGLLWQIITKAVPAFPLGMLVLMASAGLLGGIVGRKIEKRLDGALVRKLYIAVNVLIIAVCLYNAVSA